MNILVIGGGGREHAIIKKLKENPKISTIYALPGNGGIADDATCVPIAPTDIEGILAFAKKNVVDFAVVAPDDPLALGCVDQLHQLNIPCFGPDAKAARIESSKVFSKHLMEKYGIPTASYAVFEDLDLALAYLDTVPLPTVIKADGLALGKGVIIAQTRQEAKSAVTDMLQKGKFGKSGSRVVIEEFLTGPEVSVLAFTDGHVVRPMVSSMDHKRIGEGDVGLNTGGMGTIAPNPYYTEPMAQRCMDEIFLPTVRAMAAEGCPFKGCLYFGLMLTPNGPKVIEYNCRFGDPETQVVLPLLDTDLLTIMEAVEQETLDRLDIQWKNQAAACVILASGGYPESYEKGKPITFTASLPRHTSCYHAGTRQTDGTLVTSGGRVLGITATAPTLEEAIARAYEAADTVEFDNKYMRRDIGKRALEKQKSESSPRVDGIGYPIYNL